MGNLFVVLLNNCPPTFSRVAVAKVGSDVAGSCAWPPTTGRKDHASQNNDTAVDNVATCNCLEVQNSASRKKKLVKDT